MANTPQHDQMPNPSQTKPVPGQGGAANPQHRPEDKKSNPGQSGSQHRPAEKKDEKR
jgi:hypothetical protein